MNPKKTIVHDETEKTADEEETQVKKKNRKDPTPPEEPEEEPEELLDSETRLPKMRW
jgi:hypothetical protein